MRTDRVYRVPKEVIEKMKLKHIKGIICYGIMFDIYRDNETGKKYLKVEGEDGGDIVLVEITEGDEHNGTPNDGKT